MKSGVQQYLDVELTLVALLQHLMYADYDLEDEPLTALPEEVLVRLSELTEHIPISDRSPLRDPHDYERMEEVHRYVEDALSRRLEG
ncbi:MAG: hypothetical protein ABMA64_38010 [Myxococcota bacterium]